eukprot:6422611-Ditylum_brightwellii.AAC.1
MIKAAKAGYLQGCPGLKEKLICKFVKEDIETHQGHMKQARQNVWSTKRIDPMEPTEQEPGNIKTHLVFAALEEVEGRMYSDQTGTFPKVSNRGNRHAMVLYVYDANHIQGIPIKN